MGQTITWEGRWRREGGDGDIHRGKRERKKETHKERAREMDGETDRVTLGSYGCRSYYLMPEGGTERESYLSGHKI